MKLTRQWVDVTLSKWSRTPKLTTEKRENTGAVRVTAMT